MTGCFAGLVIEVLGRPDLASGEFGDRRSRTANKERLRAILTGIFVQDSRENWVTKMKAANIPVGYLRTVEEAFNSPEVRERHRVVKFRTRQRAQFRISNRRSISP